MPATMSIVRILSEQNVELVGNLGRYDRWDMQQSSFRLEVTVHTLEEILDGRRLISGLDLLHLKRA
jgi:hypothetical protein